MFPKSRGVHQRYAETSNFDLGLEQIPSGARLFVNESARLSQDLIEKGRLSCVHRPEEHHSGTATHKPAALRLTQQGSRLLAEAGQPSRKVHVDALRFNRKVEDALQLAVQLAKWIPQCSHPCGE